MADPPPSAKPAPAKRPRRIAGHAGPAPTRARLHDAALAHLARFAATEAGLIRVLDRRIDRWVRAAGIEATVDPEAITSEAIARGRLAAQEAAREVVRALVQSGVVDDTAFAAARSRSLTRAGRSRLAVGAHLAAKGVARAVAHAALADPADELAAALAYARRRRLGPFRGRDADDEVRRKELGALARAGFPQPVARQALRMDPDEALALVIRLKQGS